jgi:hypothetical protein
MNIPKPDQAADYFFKSLMHNQCHVSWTLFSAATQKVFLKWTLTDIYNRHPEAAQAAKLGEPEVKLMFEKNDPSLMKTFWKQFFYSSNANDFFRFGYYNVLEGGSNKQCVVRVTFQYPDGRTAQADLTMVNERNGWRIGYVESGLPF